MMFQVGSQGQLLEWNEEYEEADPDFYHLSPLYGLFPANQISKKDEHIYQAAVKFLKRHSLKTVWPGSWQWNLYDKIGNSDAVLNLIRKLAYRPNGGSLLDYCVPFQVDWIFGNMAGIANMFLMSEPGELYIFQAVPDLFKEGHFCGLKAKGNIEVDLYWIQDRTEIRLRTAYPQTVRLYFRNSYQQTLDLTANEEQVIILS